ncbi:MAG TPA: TatD family hydrolase [Petrimonas sp.]|jgi:TatD DNase family protein|nr:TatD family hydrolase [Petrimonas sp.]
MGSDCVDTHAHLFVEAFHDDVEAVVARAKEAGVRKVLLPNIDEDSINELKQLVIRHPGFLHPMMGLHPTSVTKGWRKQLDRVYDELTGHPPFAETTCGGADRGGTEGGGTDVGSAGRGGAGYMAVGEVGIDLYWDDSLKREQIAAFEQQLEWSRELNLPLSIHFRNATREVVESIRRVGESSLRGVFHSFGGDREELELILSLKNFMVGVNGVVTFKNSGLAGTLQYCPRDRVVAETDSPYLAPVPYRGKRNEPAYLPYVIRAIAEAWAVDAATVAGITTRNAVALFGV